MSVYPSFVFNSLFSLSLSFLSLSLSLSCYLSVFIYFRVCVSLCFSNHFNAFLLFAWPTVYLTILFCFFKTNWIVHKKTSENIIKLDLLPRTATLYVCIVQLQIELFWKFGQIQFPLRSTIVCCFFWKINFVLFFSLSYVDNSMQIVGEKRCSLFLPLNVYREKSIKLRFISLVKPSKISNIPLCLVLNRFRWASLFGFSNSPIWIT